MAKDLETQWQNAVWDAQHPLLVLSPSVDTDIFAAACALGHALRDAGKRVHILCPRAMSTHAQFLIGSLSVSTSLTETTSYTCSLPADLHVDHIDHELFAKGGGTLTLHVASGTSVDTLPALSFTPALPSFDRIVVMGAQDLSDIAPLFSESRDLLSTIPLVTFSWQTSSESFGRWNIVDEQARTLSEVVTFFLKHTQPDMLRNHVATCALAGIIARTRHFRTDLVTPHMLSVSADLVAAGAERQRIIEELYRTRSVDTLRLWGTACARLRELGPGVLFSELTPDDFVRTHSSPDMLFDIAQEILQSSNQAQEIIFFYHLDNLLHARVVTKHPRDARTFRGALRTEGTKESALHIFGKEITVRQVLESVSPENP